MQDERFESRKADHIRLAIDPKMEAVGQSGFDRIHLFHDALPELNFSSLDLETKFWTYAAASPFFLSSMTAGHHNGEALNVCLAKVASARRWPMGVGSQRKELSDPNARKEWARLRKVAQKAFLFSNLGLSQLIETPMEHVLSLIDSLEAGALIIHLNPLQEALQPEGTPRFQGGLRALEKLCKISGVPIILKETGCGFSPASLQKIQKLPISALDISGLGGTHWGRIEGGRAALKSLQQGSSETYKNWGESTVDSLLLATAQFKKLKKKKKMELWASGGIRSGLDAAKAIAIGANKVGFAKPALEAALAGEETLHAWMEQMEFELKVALFCTGSKNWQSLQEKTKWQKI